MSEWKVKIKGSGEMPNIAIGQSSQEPQQKSSPVIGNHLNGQNSCCECDTIPGWGVERTTQAAVETLPADKPTQKEEALLETEEPNTSENKGVLPPKEDSETPKSKELEKKEGSETPKSKELEKKEEAPNPKELQTKPNVKPDKPVPKEDVDSVKEDPVFEEEIPITITEPQPVEPPKNKELTPAEIKKANTDGKDVNTMLKGYTIDSEERLVADIINQEVNSDNVLEFLRGYGEGFFQQLESEYGFDEAQNLMKKIAIDLKEHIERDGRNAIAKKIAVVLEENGFSANEAKKLDEIATAYIM